MGNEMKMGKDEIKISKDALLPALSACPNCGKATMLDSGIIEVPVNIRIFFKITFTARIKVQYDPSCGYMRILLNQ